MDFKITRIPAAGRNKYGNYISSSNVSKMIISYDNYGDTTTNVNKDNQPDKTEEPQKNYTIRLSKTNGDFDWDKIVNYNGATDTISVFAYGNLEDVPVYIGDISKTPENDSDIAQNRNYDIKYLPEGMSVNVIGNGTTAATISIKVDKTITEKNGIIKIPCSVYTGPENRAPYLPSIDPQTGEYVDNAGTAEDYTDWNNCYSECKLIWLDYSYKINVNAVNNYVLELSNEMAGVNCNLDGTIVEGAVLPSGRAYLYYGNKIVENATFALSYSQYQSVYGISINTNTGVLTFGTNFSFNGTTLELNITGMADGFTSTKVMTINKIYPGKDGTNGANGKDGTNGKDGENGKDGANAINRWLVPSVDLIIYDPNTEELSVNKISVKVMKQEGGNPPVEDTGTTIYYGWNTTNPLNVYTGAIDVAVGNEYIVFALKSNNIIYEKETIPIIREGLNGQSGTSTYTLVLTNENASINCDSEGNILEGAVLPTCYAYLYYGSEEVNATFVTDENSTYFQGNELKFDEGFASNFTGDTMEITISALSNIGQVLYGTKVLTITKAKAGVNGTNGANGTNGEDAVSYWLSFSHHAFKVSSGGTASPSSIEVVPFMQIGASEPMVIPQGTYEIKYKVNEALIWLSLPPGTTLNYTTLANYYTIQLLVNGYEVDRQTIPVVRDGKNGDKGDKGEQGPTLRGPVDYNKINSPRRFSNGVATADYPEDGDFIDIIAITLPGETEKRYFKCIKSNEWDEQDIDNFDTMIGVYWEESDKFNFIATDILLADKANIAEFIFSNNKLVSQKTNSDGTPLLELDGKNGTIRAFKGIFSGLVRKTPTHLTMDNYEEYITRIPEDNSYVEYWIDLTKTGSFIHISDWTTDPLAVQLYLPVIMPEGGIHSLKNEDDKDMLRGLIGETVIVKNTSMETVRMCNGMSCVALYPDTIGYFTLKCRPEGHIISKTYSVIDDSITIFLDDLNPNIIPIGGSRKEVLYWESLVLEL